jgi:hypothetical protein
MAVVIAGFNSFLSALRVAGASERSILFAASLVYGRRRTRCSKDSLSVCSLLRAARRKSKFSTTRPRHGTGQKRSRIRLTFGVGVEADNVGVENEYDLSMPIKNVSTRGSDVITSS